VTFRTLDILAFQHLGDIVIISINSSFPIKHSWSNGRIIAFQAIGPGSTPGGCTTSFSSIAALWLISFFAFRLFMSVKPMWNDLEVQASAEPALPNLASNFNLQSCAMAVG
jgi:hypothetical protein